MHCVEVITQKILQLIIRENKIKRKSNFFLFILILFDANDILDIHKYLMKKTLLLTVIVNVSYHTICVS